MENRKEILKLYYNIIENEDMPSKKYLELQKELGNLLDELNSKMSEAERKKLEALCDCIFAMSKEQEEQAFIYGYIAANNLI